jgi:hypothetical protein
VSQCVTSKTNTSDTNLEFKTCGEGGVVGEAEIAAGVAVALFIVKTVLTEASGDPKTSFVLEFSKPLS